MSDEQETRTHHSLARPQLRLTMRQQRKALPQSARHAASYAIARHLMHTRLLAPGRRIAVYAAFDGEIDLTPFVRIAKRARCVVYAPRIVNMRARRMQFIELAPHAGYKRNQFSILEPHNNLKKRIDPRLLDVVLIPVVAFDAHGWRLGFGAGFYDRKFAFLRRGFRTKPLLIGVGYEFQRVPPQIPSSWDVLLDRVVTERGLHRCHPLQSSKNGPP